MEIRKYRDCDLDDVMNIWRNSSRYAHPFLPDEEILREEKEIKEELMPIVETWVAEENDIILGFISLINSNVGGLFVDTKYHRMGIGSNLINRACELYGDLEVDVFKENEQGNKFYKKMGFLYEKCYVEKYSGEIMNHLIMQGKLF